MKTPSAPSPPPGSDVETWDLLRLVAAVCNAPIAMRLPLRQGDDDGEDEGVQHGAERTITRGTITRGTISLGTITLGTIALGLPASATDSAVDLCARLLDAEDAVWVADLRGEAALAGHSLVIGPPALRWCAAVRLRAADGRPCGALCIGGPEPRRQHTAAFAALRVLGAQFAARIELDQTRRRLADTTSQASSADAELRLTAERVRGMLDSAIDAIVAIDVDGRVTHFNHAAEAMFGIPAAEAIGHPMVELIVPDALRDAHRAGMRRHLATGTSTVLGRRVELEAQRRDGSTFPVEIAISRIDGDGGPAFTAFLRDITEQKRLRAHAEADLRAKTEFLSRLSHDIRTPLNGIIGLTDLAIEADGAEDRDAYLRMMRDSAYGLLETVNGILDYSKIDAVGVEAVMRGFSPETTLSETLKTLAARAKARSLDFRVMHRGLERGRLLGDPGFLRQITHNLVINAIRFTERGHVRVATRTWPSANGRAAFSLTVEDSGIGIPESEHQRIFEAFTQAHDSDARQRIGNGLGLAIVRRLVDAMGGRIELESAPGLGSRFTVFLEFEHDEHGAEQAAEAPGTVAPGPAQIHVLVVDDNDTNRLVAGRLLARHGYRVTEVASGPEALAVAAEHRPTLVLMDLRLPGMNGLEAMAAIRTLPGCGQIPAIALTAHALVGDRERFMMMGMEGYVSKPFSGEALLAEMDRVLGMARMRRTRAPAARGGERFSRLIDSLDGDPRLFAIVARKAAQEFRTAAAELPEQLRQRDWPRLIEQIHKLKGSWPLYATPEHAMLADRCMAGVSRRNISTTREPLAALTAALKETAQDLEQWLERYRESR